jgi:hypothetical protein
LFKESSRSRPRAIRDSPVNAASDRDTGDPNYQIKSVHEKHEHIVFESDLTLSSRSEFFA